MHLGVKQKFESYPSAANRKLAELRQLIFDVADELNLGNIEESLKWGQPSYLAVNGSPIRLGWDAKQPQSISLYVNCNSKLVATYRELYADQLVFVGHREIKFDMASPLPIKPLKHCIQLALTYHKVKLLPLLGC